MARKRKTDGRTPRRALWARTLIAITACGVAVGGLAAYRSYSDGSATAAERPVTTEEASRLALSRLNLYQASPVAVTLTAAEGGGVVVRVKGVVDYRAHRAVGSYQVTGSTESSGALGPPVTGQLDHGLIVWDAGGLGLAPVPEDDSGPPWQQAEQIPRSGWSSRSYTSDPLDAGLQLLIGLGADRPDNPMLLAQSGARWLGRDRIDGRGYDRFAGPRAQGATPGAGSDGGQSPLTYWVDGDGGLRRVTMRMPGLGTPTTVEFSGREDRAKLPEAPWGTG